MKKNLMILFGLVLIFGSNAASAQFTIKLPKLPKVEKPKQEREEHKSTQTRDTNTAEQPKVSGSKNIYSNQRPTGTPVFLRNSMYVEATTHDEYWKMPNQKYSSWVPKLKFKHFFDNSSQLNYTVEFFNPDGSSWFTEKLKQTASAADRTVPFEAETFELLKTKSTAATGIFSFKITDQDSGEILFKGKFKVGKFSTANRPTEKNQFAFYVEHDWLQPYGIVGFHHADIDLGGEPIYVSVWLKGMIEAKELEGRIFYQGRQIATTKDRDSGASDYDQRSSHRAVPFAPQTILTRWEFAWNNFRFDNNGSFNRSYYPDAHYADKNPGEYTVKIYHNGTQIREMTFLIGPDGRIALPPYSKEIPLPYHRIVVPVKPIGTNEKWNSAVWKTEAFYGNPLTGF